MNLVFHIVRKDGRAIAAPLATWLALIALHTILFSVYHAGITENPAGWTAARVFEFLSVRTDLERHFLPLIEGLELFIAALLVFRLVNEDPVADNRAFWRARPIAGGPLLAAKAAGSVIFFVVAPAVVLALIWSALGYSVRDVVASLHSLQFGVSTLVIAALGVATVFSGVVTFLAVSCLWIIGRIIGLDFDGTTPEAAPVRMFLLVVWLSPPIIAAIVQYTKPTRRLGLMVLSAGFLALLASNRWVPRHSPEIVGEIQGAVEHRIVPRITGYDAQQLTVTTDSPNEGRLVPAVVGARLFGLDNRPPAIVDWNPAADWGGAAAVAVVRGKVIGATQWNLQRGNRDISPTGDPRATWMIAWVRPRVAWRLTARDGEATRIGAESVQIEFVARDARTASYFVTERWPVGQEADRADVRRVDAYVLLAPDGASAVAADVHEIRALNSNGVAVVWRELRFRLPNGSEQGNAAALDGGVLVKVEFVSDRTFECTTPLDPRPNGRPF